MLRVDSISCPVGFWQWLFCKTPPREIVSALFRVFKVTNGSCVDVHYLWWLDGTSESICHACAISLQCSKTPWLDCEKCHRHNERFNITMRWSWNIVIFCGINDKGGSYSSLCNSLEYFSVLVACAYRCLKLFTFFYLHFMIHMLSSIGIH